jgi:small conductance mechanosensitive channel
MPALTPAHLNSYTAAIWTWAVAFIPHFVAAILILIAGYAVASWAARSTRTVLDRAGHLDVTVRPVIAAVVRYAILILVLTAALGQIGIQTASLFAVLGAAGLAIGLALQGTLTNIAGGIMLLWQRPFRVGDYIEVPGLSGTVKEIGLFVCLLENLDGISVVAQNNSIWNNVLRNHSHNSSGRLIVVAITISSRADVGKARETLLQMLNEDTRVWKVPQPLVFPDSYNSANGVVLNCSFRASPLYAGDMQRTIVERIRHNLQASGVEALEPQQIVRITPPDSDPSRLLP